MRISFKNLMFLFVAMMLALAIVGCSSGDDETNSDTNDGTETSGNTDSGETEETEDTSEPVTLTYLIDNTTSTDGLEAVAAEIEERFNIKTEIELRPGGSEGDNLVKTRLATGDMTDLMGYNSGSLFKALSPEEYFVDLSGEAFIESVIPSFANAVSVGGKVFGIPAGSGQGGGFLYNTKVYEELGLEVPHTWDELLANNEVIKEAGTVPVAAAYKDSWTSQVVLLSDYYNVYSEMPSFAEEFTNNEAKFADTPIALRGFEKLAELQEAGHYNEEAAVTTNDAALEMLATGEAAHYPMITFVTPSIAENFPDQVNDIGFFGTPGENADDHGMTMWLPQGIYVNKESEHVEEAKQWMEFFLSEEGMEIYMAAEKAFGPYAVEGVQLPDDAFTLVKDMVPYIDAGKAAPALEFLSPLKGPNLPQITVEAGLGMTSAHEAAQKYDDDVRKQAVQLGIEGWE